MLRMSCRNHPRIENTTFMSEITILPARMTMEKPNRNQNIAMNVFNDAYFLFLPRSANRDRWLKRFGFLFAFVTAKVVVLSSLSKYSCIIGWEWGVKGFDSLLVLGRFAQNLSKICFKNLLKIGLGFL